MALGPCARNEHTSARGMGPQFASRIFAEVVILAYQEVANKYSLVLLSLCAYIDFFCSRTGSDYYHVYFSIYENTRLVRYVRIALRCRTYYVLCVRTT